MTVQQFITSQPSIHGLESTNRAANLGKVFLKSDVTHILDARAFVDSIIKQLYKSGSVPPAMILEAFNPPCHGDAPCTSLNFQSYASILANLGTPKKMDKNAMMAMLVMEAAVAGVVDKEAEVAKVPKASQTHPSPSCKDEIKKEYMAMIQQDIQTQIQTQTQAFKNEVSNLMGKINGMQEGM